MFNHEHLYGFEAVAPCCVSSPPLPTALPRGSDGSGNAQDGQTSAPPRRRLTPPLVLQHTTALPISVCVFLKLSLPVASALQPLRPRDGCIVACEVAKTAGPASRDRRLHQPMFVRTSSWSDDDAASQSVTAMPKALAQFILFARRLCCSIPTAPNGAPAGLGWQL